jgi:putative transposase
MIIKKAYKFRLKTNPVIEQKLWLYAGHCRFVWNYFWAMNQFRLENKQRILRYAEMDYWSKLLKASDEYGFLKEAPAHILQQKLKDLDKAYQDGFDRNQPHKRLPTKRKKALHSSFRFPEPKQFKIKNKRIFLPKLGWLSFFQSQKIEGELKNATLSYKAGHWYISLQVECENTLAQAKGSIALDLGVAQLVTGVTEANEVKIFTGTHSYRKQEQKLKLLQQKLSRKVKFSKNWSKQKRKVQYLHASIANTRRHHLHKISHTICKNHAVIYMEDLKVKNMSKSAKGSIEHPGRNVSAKAGLNKSILDQGWGELRRQLEYKSSWRGGIVIPINPQYTSQTCSRCSYTDKENRKTQATFECTACGFQMNADENAARNIMAAGLCRDGLWIEPHKRSKVGTCVNV